MASGDGKVYGVNYEVNVVHAEQKGYGTYYNDPSLSFIEDYTALNIQYIKTGEWARTDQIDQMKTVLNSKTTYTVIYNQIKEKFQDYQNNLTKYTFVNDTVKTEYANGNKELLYSNGTKYVMTLNGVGYDIQIEVDPTLNQIHNIFLNGTVRARNRVPSTNDYQV